MDVALILLALSGAVLALALAFLLLATAIALLWKVSSPERPIPLLGGKSAATDEEAALGMPDYLRDYIQLESEDWAQDDLRQEALRLGQLLDYDWERVHEEMQRRHGAYDLDPDSAADIAWTAAGRTMASPEPS